MLELGIFGPSCFQGVPLLWWLLRGAKKENCRFGSSKDGGDAIHISGFGIILVTDGRIRGSFKDSRL